MPTPHPEFVYLDGQIVPWDDAKLHVFSPAVKYGAGVFEGIRGYWNEDENQMYVFRVAEHLARLRYSQIMMRFDRIFEPQDVEPPMLELIRRNGHRATIHIRPTVFVDGYQESAATGPIGMFVTTFERPASSYLQTGCSVQVSSWQRLSDRAMPVRVKANANYNNSRYAGIQARVDGYDTAIMLNDRGQVSEGPGMCLFIVRGGRPLTPSVTSDILESITRDTVIEILDADFGLSTTEREIGRSELYAAEEAFFCGTAWEVTPITSIDGLAVGDGQVGPITKRLQDRYFDIVHGRVADDRGWLTPVY